MRQVKKHLLIGDETCNQHECAVKKKRLADVLIECKQSCCIDASGPLQTTDNTNLAKTTITYPDGMNRHFPVVWYKQYNCVVLCDTKAKAFCFYCRFATYHALMVVSSKAEDAFVRRMLKKNLRITKSVMHILIESNSLKFNIFTKPNIIECMNVQLLEDQEFQRLMLKPWLYRMFLSGA